MASLPARGDGPQVRLLPAVIVAAGLLALAVAGGAIAAQVSSLRPVVSVNSTGPSGSGAVAPDTVTVQGVGRVKVAPDAAIVSLGVSSASASAADAMSAAAAGIGKLMDAIKANGVDGSAISTQWISVYPANTGPYGQPNGYTAAETVSVRLADLGAVAGVIGAASAAAGNDFRLNNVQLVREDQAAQLADARKAALAAAAGTAGQLASGSSHSLGALRSVSEVSSGYLPPGGGGGFGMGGAGTAGIPVIEPGLGEVVVVVSATYGLGAK